MDDDAIDPEWARRYEWQISFAGRRRDPYCADAYESAIGVAWRLLG